MSEALNLIKIGSMVRVDLSMVRDRIPSGLIELLSSNSIGTVVDYKMTDGTGIGMIVRLSDGSINWFFSEELDQLEGANADAGFKDQNFSGIR